MSHLMPTHNPLPITVERARGLEVWDTDGNCYLDTFSGLGVCPLGHTHPEVVKAIHQQATTLIHTSNALHHEHAERLAAHLFHLTGLSRAFFTNSGAESVEAALKLARLYGHEKGIHTPQILVFDQGFHGRSLATLSATGFRRAQAGFEPLVEGFIRAPFDDIESVEAIAAENPHICAVLIEPIQGAAGIRIPSEGYLKALRALCDAKGYLLIADEIQSGLGRTGMFLESHRQGAKPDIVLLAKGLANGVPIGACLAREDIGMLFTDGKHGSTFGGNPLATHTANTVLSLLASEHLIESAQEKGSHLTAALSNALSSHALVSEVRGAGLMIGIECHEPCSELAHKALKLGLLLNVTNQSVIRLLPSLTISDEQMDSLTEKLYSLFKSL